eukprot:3186114-Pyramimonas_sp.AAC.1
MVLPQATRRKLKRRATASASARAARAHAQSTEPPPTGPTLHLLHGGTYDRPPQPLTDPTRATI